jgi:circadian clock protein KaiC
MKITGKALYCPAYIEFMVDIGGLLESIRGKVSEKETPEEERKDIKVEETQEGREDGSRFFKTGIEGLDDLCGRGIPVGSNVLVGGGPGSGKTILTLQILVNAAKRGEKCLYMSFEESEKRLKKHMKEFGWSYEELEAAGNLIIKRFDLFDITRSMDALLAKAKGELLIDLEPIILPQNFRPDVVIVDSLSAIAAAFTGKDENYRIYAEQLFRFFEKLGITSFLITETEPFAEKLTAGVEEFLSDGVIILYNIRRGNIRESAIEVYKLRGTSHKKRIVAMKITENGIEIYPTQEVFRESE